MTTNEKRSKTRNKHHEDQPAKKKRRPSRTMKDDARDSLVEFESSIFDASDGHKLVNFIRKKKGLCAQPQKIFDEVRSNRESLQIEILKLNEDVRPLESEKIVENEARPESRSNTDTNQNKTPRVQHPKSPFIDPKLKLKRLSTSIAYRALLKEFEKTLHDSRFLPETCSTPLTNDPPVSATCSWNTPKDVALSKLTKQSVQKSTNVNLVCTPITISDNASEGSENDKTLRKESNTEEVIRELQDQNDLLLELAQSDEEPEDELNITVSNNHNQDNPLNSPNRLQPIFNKTSTPLKKDQRRTFTVHRENISGKLVLEPVESSKENVQQPASPKTPVKNATVPVRKLYATPKQKQLLLSRFNRNAALATTSRESVATAAPPNTTSRIPVKRTIEFKAVESGSGPSQIETAVLSQDTSKIIEQLQKKTSSNAPIIVIPVSQTFNQGTGDKSRVGLESPSSRDSHITPNISKPIQQAEPIVAPSVKHHDELPINNLRLEDIITDDESNHSSNNEDVTRVFSPSKSAKQQSVQPTSPKLSKQSQRQMSPNTTSQTNSSRHIREVVKPSELAEMNTDEILDLRKRNSRGQLRTTFQLSKRECSMLDKQVELELLRRSIQDKNYEDEVLQMGVLPPPPEQFSDARKSTRLHQSNAFPILAAESDLEGERSSDRIVLSQNASKKRKSMKTRNKKMRKMSEQMEKYLEVSQRVSTSKYLNLSKRKLYNKGLSDATSSSSSSDDSSPNTTSKRTTAKNKTPRISRQSTGKISLRSTDSSLRNMNSNSVASLETQCANQPSCKVNNDVIFKKPVGRPRKKLVAEPVSNEKKTPQKELFMPADNNVFKKPTAQRAGKNRSKQCALEDDTTSVSSTTTSGGTNTRRKTPPHPVDPDLTTANAGVRRSYRERKPLTAYWSCSYKEYKPLYSITFKDLSTKKKKSVVIPRNKDSLVDNTKAKKSSSVKKVQVNKKSQEKLHKEHNSVVAKNQGKGKSKGQSTITTYSQDCPSNQSSINETSNCPTTLVPAYDESNMIIRHQDRDNLSDSNDSDNERTTSAMGQKQLEVDKEVSRKCQTRNLQSKLTVITEGEEFDANHTTRLVDSEDSLAPKRKGRQIKKTQQLTNVRQSTKDQVGASKSKGKQSKAIISSKRSQSTTSDCETDENASSIQQPRLQTIVEDSIPELTRHGTISTTNSIQENDSTSGNKLMRMPLASVKGKHLRVCLKNAVQKGSFRKEHDESIADVSSVKVHKLFDQLKSSTMCGPSDVTAIRVSCSEQNSLGSRIQNQSDAVPKLRNLTVRLLRVKNKKQIASQHKEKVCDSGFSSEEMSSDPKENGDILLNWLKQLVNNGNCSSHPQKGVARFLQSDGFHVASIDDLVFEELSGVEYAFYNTQQRCSFGYMRFNPKAEKKKSTAKNYELSFCVICGEVKLSINGNPVHCKNGDLVTVFKGSSYNIKNCSNDPALVMVIRR